eukprot:6184803-Pleurochrysis_carterae.AAC.4
MIWSQIRVFWVNLAGAWSPQAGLLPPERAGGRRLPLASSCPPVGKVEGLDRGWRSRMGRRQRRLQRVGEVVRQRKYRVGHSQGRAGGGGTLQECPRVAGDGVGATSDRV